MAAAGSDGSQLALWIEYQRAAHASRLNRELGKRFGDRAYQAEELVAEIGSAMVCAMLEITQDVRPDHAQYLSHWLELMRSDPKAIFTAASKASQAVDYLVSLQPQVAPDPDPVPSNDPKPEPETTTDQRRAPHRDDTAIARRGRRRPPEAKR